MAQLNNVPVQWCSIQAADTQFEPQWCVEAILTEGQAATLVAESKKFNSKGIKIKNKDGVLSYRFTRRVLRGDGDGENTAPKCVDAANTPLNKLVGNGSICNIQYSFFGWDNKFGNGVKSDFKGLQVLDLVSYGEADGDSFSDTTSGFSDTSTTTNVSETTSEEYNDEDFS